MFLLRLINRPYPARPFVDDHPVEQVAFFVLDVGFKIQFTLPDIADNHVLAFKIPL